MKKRVLSKDVSLKINQILRRVVTEGTASLADVKGIILAEKQVLHLLLKTENIKKK